jgi:hypothetical protein
MVSFAIAETSSSLPLNNQLNNVISLRDDALWFPDIPESNLQLNETYFHSQDKAVSGFRPLCYCLRASTSPGSLLKVVAIADSQKAVVRIEFDYATIDRQILGRLIDDPWSRTISEYFVKREAGEGTDIMTFRKKRDRKCHEVSNY